MCCTFYCLCQAPFSVLSHLILNLEAGVFCHPQFTDRVRGRMVAIGGVSRSTRGFISTSLLPLTAGS